MNYFVENIHPGFTKIMTFLLTQDPRKIAIGMAIGMSFTKIFNELILVFVTPLVRGILYTLSKTGFKYIVFGQPFNVGNIIEQLITFVLFIIIIYYCVILPIDNLKRQYNIDQKTKPCPYCKSLINPLAVKCPACTSDLSLSSS